MNNVENRTLFFGDNLDILKEKIPSESVDLIYLDPPFNSNRAYNILHKNNGEDSPSQIEAFNDTWNWNTIGVQENFNRLVENKENIKISDLMIGLEKVIGKNGTLAYLSMMTTRLIELKRVLKSTGSIYLHCDPSASHYLKIVMDIIFGEENFVNEIIWSYKSGGISQCSFSRKHDTILFYSKTNKYKFNLQKESRDISELKKKYKQEDEKGHYGQMKKDGKKYYFEDGVTMRDVWEIPILNQLSKERLGYPTQKPEALLERIIKASSNEGDIVLDPFCGCGTTVAVSERLNRKWIGIDITPLAINVIRKRMVDHYPNIKINLDGLPKDLDGAKMLAEQCGINGRFDFQYWILSLINARPAPNKSKNQKKGKDYGIDGIIRYNETDINFKNEYKDIIISVKSGKNPKSPEIRDLRGVIENRNASGGIYVTLYPPTNDMLKEATLSGTYKYQNISIPKLQICLVEDILNGIMPLIPQSQEINLCKKAEKVEIKEDKSKQKSLFE